MNALATPGAAGIAAVLLLIIAFATLGLSMLGRIPADLYDIEDDLDESVA